MSLADLAGRTFAPTEPYAVTPERIEQFASATGGAYTSGPAPVTFPIVVVLVAFRELVARAGTALSMDRIVHGEQSFTFQRQVQPNDRLTAELTVESVRTLGSTDYIRTSSAVRDEHGDLVVTARATLVHRGAVPSRDASPDADPDAIPAPRAGRP